MNKHVVWHSSVFRKWIEEDNDHMKEVNKIKEPENWFDLQCASISRLKCGCDPPGEQRTGLSQ